MTDLLIIQLFPLCALCLGGELDGFRPEEIAARHREATNRDATCLMAGRPGA